MTSAVPGRPADVKVFAFALYILITWKPPTEPNGIITNYQAGSAKYTGSEPKDTPVEMTQLAASKRRHLIGQQEELTNYVVEIRAKTEPGYGESVRIATRTVKISRKSRQIWKIFLITVTYLVRRHPRKLKRVCVSWTDYLRELLI